MRPSRLRTRLAVRFGAAFMVGLVALDFLLFLQLHRRDHRRLTRELNRTGAAFLAGVRNRFAQSHEPLPVIVEWALTRWPLRTESYAFFDEANHLLGIRAPQSLVPLLTAGPPPGLLSAWEARGDSEAPLRLVQVSDTVGGTLVRVIVARSTTDLRRRDKLLGMWLGGSLPIVVLFSIVIGYVLAGSSLEPIHVMARSIAALAPHDLDRRLPVRAPPDELDVVAQQFNALLGRLGEAQARNRIFVAQAAHQLKTPLTIVRGESALGLEHSHTEEEYKASLGHIHRAAEQMAHRVESLLLLAHAQAGERPPVADWVELDGLAFECADLMRRPAQRLPRALCLDRIEPVHAQANEVLLREALLELIQNALKHGTSAAPVAISVYRTNGCACAEVVNSGPPAPPTAFPDSNGPPPPPAQWAPGSDGMGLSIVRWIAAVHAGELRYTRRGDTNVFSLV